MSEADAVLDRLTATGQLLTTWPPAPFERTPTVCFRVGPTYWIWQPDVGGLSFDAAPPHLNLHPLPTTDRQWFQHLVYRSWLPAIYPIWGRQVLHASAVAAASSGDVIAFTGASGAGKSTTAYGLSRRPGWLLAADDTLAFSNDLDAPSAPASLYPLRVEARLRPATAAYFGEGDATEVPFAWPSMPLRLKIVYVLDGTLAATDEPRLTQLRTSESYQLLLAQAHAMTLQLREHNQRLMRDYLALAAGIATFRFSYPKTFDRLDGVFEQLEAHARDHGVAWDPRPGTGSSGATSPGATT